MNPKSISIRTTLRPGDLGTIVALHGTIYAAEYGFDHTFEAYVAGPLSRFVSNASARARLWIAEREERIAGCIAIVADTPHTAQLRWFLVAPPARGCGLGTRLLKEAVSFARENEFESVTLWTVSVLTVAARLYRAAGFQRVESRPRRLWGCDVVEEKYELNL